MRRPATSDQRPAAVTAAAVTAAAVTAAAVTAAVATAVTAAAVTAAVATAVAVTAPVATAAQRCGQREVCMAVSQVRVPRRTRNGRQAPGPGGPNGQARRRRGPTRHNRVGYAFFAPFLVVFAVAIVAPLGYAFYLSLYQTRLIGGTVFSGFANYTQALTDHLFQVGVEHVALLLAIQVPIMLLLAMLVALAIDSGRLKGAKIFRIGIFIPYAIPAVVGAAMWGYLTGGQFGLAGQIGQDLHVHMPDFLSSSWMLATIGNVVTWGYTGYNMLIMYAALRAVPTELYEAAEVDGAGEIRKAWSIKVPALRRALLLTTTFSIIGTFQLFNEPSVMHALAPTVVTTNYTPNLYDYHLAFEGQEFNYAGAVAVILGLVTVVLAYAVQIWGARKERQS
jgi:multiple sugar transport system permease protein